LIGRDSELGSDIGVVEMVSIVEVVSLHRVEQSRLGSICFIVSAKQDCHGCIIKGET
jgi:hypothetical protein